MTNSPPIRKCLAGLAEREFIFRFVSAGGVLLRSENSSGLTKEEIQMNNSSRGEFTKLYPNRSKPLLDCAARTLRELKEKGKSAEGLVDLRNVLEALKIRCMILNFKKHTTLLQEIIKLLDQLEAGTSIHGDAIRDILLESFENLEKYFLKDESTVEKETERLIYKIMLLQRMDRTALHENILHRDAMKLLSYKKHGF